VSVWVTSEIILATVPIPRRPNQDTLVRAESDARAEKGVENRRFGADTLLG